MVDTGYVKTRFITNQTGVDMLKTLPVSKFQANQRKGRAGRESPGKCFRLYTEQSYNELSIAPLPEIQRTNIAQVLLQLKVLGIIKPTSFPFISPPTEASILKAFQLLFALGAFDNDQSLSIHGKAMASLPLDPMYANLLLKSQEMNCVAEVLTTVSLLSADNIFVQPYREEEKQAAALAHRHFASKEG